MKIYNIGAKVWYAKREAITEREPCPECFGKRYLTVILGDESEVTIDCVGCASGFEAPKGYILYYKQTADVARITIDRVEINRDYVEYLFNECRIARDTEVFITKEEAEIRAKELAEEHNRQEYKRIHRKEKNNRTWSWHVHYYRKMIRNAERDIERAKERLDVAKEKQGKEANQ